MRNLFISHFGGILINQLDFQVLIKQPVKWSARLVVSRLSWCEHCRKMIQFWRYGFDFYFNWVATLSPQKRSSDRVPNRCWQIDFSDTCHGPVAGFGFGRFDWENPKVSNGCGPKLCRCFQRIGVVSWLLRHTTFSCKPNLAMGKWKNRSFVQVEKVCLEISWDPSQGAAAMDIGYKPFPRCTHFLLQHGDFPTSYG